MKKFTIAVSALLASCVAIPSAMASGAPVTSHDFRFECPNASGGTASERLTRYVSSISGMGEENIDGVKSALPVFRGVPSAGVPMDLSTGAYTHAGVLYNEHSGRVTCLFTSSNGSDPFNVSYTTLNIKNGFVVKIGMNRITIRVGQGVR